MKERVTLFSLVSLLFVSSFALYAESKEDGDAGLPAEDKRTEEIVDIDISFCKLLDLYLGLVENGLE